MAEKSLQDVLNKIEEKRLGKLATVERNYEKAVKQIEEDADNACTAEAIRRLGENQTNLHALLKDFAAIQKKQTLKEELEYFLHVNKDEFDLLPTKIRERMLKDLKKVPESLIEKTQVKGYVFEEGDKTSVVFPCDKELIESNESMSSLYKQVLKIMRGVDSKCKEAKDCNFHCINATTVDSSYVVKTLNERLDESDHFAYNPIVFERAVLLGYHEQTQPKQTGKQEGKKQTETTVTGARQYSVDDIMGKYELSIGSAYKALRAAGVMDRPKKGRTREILESEIPKLEEYLKTANFGNISKGSTDDSPQVLKQNLSELTKSEYFLDDLLERYGVSLPTLYRRLRKIGRYQELPEGQKRRIISREDVLLLDNEFDENPVSLNKVLAGRKCKGTRKSKKPSKKQKKTPYLTSKQIAESLEMSVRQTQKKIKKGYFGDGCKKDGLHWIVPESGLRYFKKTHQRRNMVWYKK